MPFDGKLTDFISVPIVKPFEFGTATADARLLFLASKLEREQEWRDKIMSWDYAAIVVRSVDDCGTAGCAIGLASIIWPGFSIGDVYSAFGLTPTETSYLFCGNFTQLPMRAVTPGMVATAIREFVAKRSAS